MCRLKIYHETILAEECPPTSVHPEPPNKSSVHVDVDQQFPNKPPSVDLERPPVLPSVDLEPPVVPSVGLERPPVLPSVDLEHPVVPSVGLERPPVVPSVGLEPPVVPSVDLEPPPKKKRAVINVVKKGICIILLYSSLCNTFSQYLLWVSFIYRQPKHLGSVNFLSRWQTKKFFSAPQVC